MTSHVYVSYVNLFRYTYFWLTKFPRTIFQHTFDIFRHLLPSAEEEAMARSGRNKWVLTDGVAGCAATVIGLMARKQVGGGPYL